MVSSQSLLQGLASGSRWMLQHSVSAAERRAGSGLQPEWQDQAGRFGVMPLCEGWDGRVGPPLRE